MPDSASSVPPFIPGLLIVSLLIIISIIIGYRNYVLRGNPRLVPGTGDWTLWEDSGTDAAGGSNRPEKPKMWEVGVGGVEKGASDEGWERIMPLAATSVSSELLDLESPTQPSRNGMNMTTSPRSSPPLTRPAPSPEPASSPTSSLQVAVLISMPSLHRRPSLPVPADEDHPPRPSTSSSMWKETMSVDVEDIPDVALGVVVLPLRTSAEHETGMLALG